MTHHAEPRPTFDELYDQHWHAQHGPGRMGVSNAYAIGDAAPARWNLTVPLVIVAGFIVWTLIVLAVVNALSRSDWPAACEGLTTAAECAARMGQP